LPRNPSSFNEDTQQIIANNNNVIYIKSSMAFGKLRKIWNKIKSIGKRVYGGIKSVVNHILPIAKTVAPMVATAIGGPGAGAATSTGLAAVDKVFNGGGRGIPVTATKLGEISWQ
jgi:hypothetical protein